jgi:5-methylcytosine-specific restriction endonuclease McrA
LSRIKYEPPVEVIPEKRKTLSKTAKLRIIMERHWCRLCGKPLGDLDDLDWDHVIPLALGGTQTEDNFEPVHKACHKIKTREDVRQISKAKRIIERRNGQRKPRRKIPSRPFQKKEKE